MNKGNLLVKKIREIKSAGSKALVFYLTAGYPGMKTTEKVILALERGDADIIELGVPFSDPVADGPTIQFSSQKALEKGTTLAKILGFVKRLRKKTDIPVMLMSYINPIAVFGVKRFFRHAAGSGISGLLVTDLPVEESGPFQKASRESGVPLIFLVSPTTTKERKKLISRNSKAFIYAVSLTGITGARKRLEKTTIPFLEETRKTINKPLYVGFGISDPRQARMLKDHCDGIIIGSALVELIRKTPDILIEQNAELFAKKFREALNGRKPLD